MKFIIGAILIMCVLGHTLATVKSTTEKSATKKTTPTKSTTVKSAPASKKPDSEKPKTNDQETIEKPSNQDPVEEPETETTQAPEPAKKSALEGLWEIKGELKICGYCVDKNGSSTDCDKKTGACPIKGKCADGYSGDMCTEFKCKGGCGEGSCVAPETCYCGENINLDARSGCTDIRIRGLMGSAAALIILTLVVFMCSSVSKSVRRKERARLAELEKIE